MKRRFAALLAGAVFALSATALADVTVTQTGTFGYANWIDGSNLMEMGEYGNYYIADAQGNALTESGYTSLDYSHGYISARVPSEDVNNYGLLTLAGQEIVPFAYGDIKVLNANWAVGYKLVLADANQYDYESWFSDEDKYFLIETVDVYHLTGDAAALAGSFPRENFLDVYAQGNYISIQNRADEKVTMYDGDFNVFAEDIGSVYADVDGTKDYVFTRENGQQGISDKDGNVLVAPSYQYIYEVTEDGYARVSTGDTEGLIDLSGNVVVPAQYDSLRRNYYGGEDYDGYIAAGYVSVEREGKAAFCDINGNETMEAKYAKDNVDVCGASAMLTDMEGNVHILAADGTDTVLDEAHKEARALYHGNGLLYKFNDADYNCGLMDWHGNEIFPAQYSDFSLSGDGSMLLAEIDYSQTEMYSVNYDLGLAAPAAQAAPADGEGTQEASAADVAETQEAAPTEEGTAPAAEDAAQPEAAPAEGASAVGALFDSIISLVQTDFETNRSAVATLISTATSMLGEDQSAVKSILDSAATIINSGMGDADTVASLLESAKSLIG